METTVTEQTTPIPWRNLRLVKGGTDAPGTDLVPPGTEGGTEGTVPLPVPPAGPGTVSALSPAERAQLTARHWGSLAANGAGQMWLHPDRLLHDMWHKGPAPMNGHVAYVKSSAWVPEELRGHKSGGFLKWLGRIHYALVAWPLKLLALGLSAAADRALRFYLTLAVVLVLAFAVVPHIHLHL